MLVEEQLTVLTERQAAVEARLQQIRAVIIRRYRDDEAPAHDGTRLTPASGAGCDRQ